MKADQIIENVKKMSEIHYREGESDARDRLAYRVGLLEGKLMELCAELDTKEEVIKNLELEIIAIKSN